MAHRFPNYQELMDARKAMDAAKAVTEKALKELERDTAMTQEEILVRRMATVDLKERRSAESQKRLASAQRIADEYASHAAKAKKASIEKGGESKNATARPAKTSDHFLLNNDTTKGAHKGPAPGSPLGGFESRIPKTRVDGATAPRRQFVPVAAAQQMKKDLESLTERCIMPWEDVVPAPVPVPTHKKSEKVTFDATTAQPQKTTRTKPVLVSVAADAQRPPNHVTWTGFNRLETGPEAGILYTATFDRSFGKDNTNNARNSLRSFNKAVASTANTKQQADGVSTGKNIVHSQLFGSFDITTLLDNYPGNSAATTTSTPPSGQQTPGGKTGKKFASSEASKPVGTAKVDPALPTKHDDDFHVVSGKVPSATNGARLDDSNTIIDQIDEDFSPTVNSLNGWDDDGDEIDDSLEWDMGGLAEWQWVGEKSAKVSKTNGGV